MPGINTGKVIAGGLVAGLVFNILDFASNSFLLGADFSDNMMRLGLDPAVMESGSGIATWVILDFLMGLLVVWTYAAIRPRFGPGAKTAVYAGLIPYLGTALILFGLTQGGLLTSALYWKMGLVQLFVFAAGSIAGASVYKES
jgi:hypothetical protein